MIPTLLNTCQSSSSVNFMGGGNLFIISELQNIGFCNSLAVSVTERSRSTGAVFIFSNQQSKY
jgi:hypothetical protein